jgi:uncharacterized phage-associated protein
MPYQAQTIAKWFIEWAQDQGDPVSNMKLQKLLYYAQGQYLARHHEPLFTDPIEAWSHGPVVPSVYHEFKTLGADPIELPDSDPFQWSDVGRGDADFLSTVWNTYGGYTAGRLRNMTHDEPPWKEAFSRGAAAIVPENMEQYFGKIPGRG